MTACRKCGAVEQEREVREIEYRWRKEGPPPGDGWIGPIFPHAQLQIYERPRRERFFDCKFVCPNPSSRIGTHHAHRIPPRKASDIMSDNRTIATQFENALIDLIEQYVEAGLTNADIRGVLDARRDDDHEYRDADLAKTVGGPQTEAVKRFRESGA